MTFYEAVKNGSTTTCRIVKKLRAHIVIGSQNAIRHYFRVEVPKEIKRIVS